MRVRTDDRRNAILEAAIQIFREVGYERASMAMIAERVGGSKTTLYGYFPSKEELFWDAMVGSTQLQRGEKALALLDPSDPDVSGVLERFGTAYLPLFYDAQYDRGHTDGHCGKCHEQGTKHTALSARTQARVGSHCRLSIATEEEGFDT